MATSRNQVYHGLVFVELLVNYWCAWFTIVGLHLPTFPHQQNGESSQFPTFSNFYLFSFHLASLSL